MTTGTTGRACDEVRPTGAGGTGPEATLREALAWYADPANWYGRDRDGFGWHPSGEDDAERLQARPGEMTPGGRDVLPRFAPDCGDRARRALAGAATPEGDRVATLEAEVARLRGLLAVPPEVLAALAAATRGPIAASPQEGDDWGVLRVAVPDADGCRPVVARVNVGLDDETERRDARAERHEPRLCAANGAVLAAGWNRLVEQAALGTVAG